MAILTDKEKVKADKTEKVEKIAAIERKMVRYHKAIRVIESLEDNSEDVKSCVTKLKARVELLEKNAFELMKQRFASLKS